MLKPLNRINICSDTTNFKHVTYKVKTIIPVPGGIIGPPCSWGGGYKYRNLVLQVGEVSDETVKYGYGF
jgi:hypothetical protein